MVVLSRTRAGENRKLIGMAASSELVTLTARQWNLDKAGANLEAGTITGSVHVL